MSDETRISIVGLSGSLRKDGYTAKVLEIALQGAKELGAQTQCLFLGDYDLVFCDGRPRDQYPEGVMRLRTDIQQAHGILIGTPEYHGSFSGVLKNALDLMGFKEFEGKMLGLLGVGGGSLGAMQSLNSLRSVGRALHAWVIPEQVSIPKVREHFNQEGDIDNDQLKERLLDVGRQVARFAYLHNADQTRSFLKLWEQAPQNPGGM